MDLRPPTAHVAASPLTAAYSEQALPNERHTRTQTDFRPATPDDAMAVVVGTNEEVSPLKATAKSSTRKLCLCSKLEVLHYAHGPGEKPTPMNGPRNNPDNSMDMDDDA